MCAASLSPSNPQFLSFAAWLDELERLLQEQETAIESEESALADMQATTLPELQHMHEQMLQQHAEVTACEHLQPTGVGAATARATLANPTTSSSTVPSGGSASKSASTKGKATARSAISISMPPVSDAEFSSIPSYMRGRLDSGNLNKAIDAWLAALQHKYSLLATPPAQLSSAQQEQVKVWSAEESPETSGRFFLSSDDLRQCAPLQALGSTTLKAVLLGLRHIGRVSTVANVGVAPKYVLQ